jgi:hypothetical protein
MQKFMFILSIALLLLINTCNENPINSDENIPPGRRDYVWTVDTIPVQYAVMKDMWGSSPTDIWICGDADNRRESVWHYDGNNFTPSGEYILDPTSLWGASPNDIWLGTAASELWHYDGSKWEKFKNLSLPEYNDIIIQSICGTSATDIYASGMANSLDGYRGIILHFNGTEWNFVEIPKINVSFGEMEFDASTNSFILYGANFDHIGTPERLYVLKNNVLTELYEGEILKYPGYIGNEVYIYQINSQEIYKYSKGSLELFLNLKNSDYGGGLWGRNTKDFFCSTMPNNNKPFGIGHYNGTNLITIFETSLRFFRPVLFNNEVFFLGFDADDFTQVIIKGVLKDK